MAKHHSDLVFCRKLPGIAIGRLCEKCEGKCVICDSLVRPHVLVRICDECNYGSFEVTKWFCSVFFVTTLNFPVCVGSLRCLWIAWDFRCVLLPRMYTSRKGCKKNMSFFVVTMKQLMRVFADCFHLARWMPKNYKLGECTNRLIL